MKLSKSLLKAIAIGVTVGTATSCLATLHEIEEPSETKALPGTESCAPGEIDWSDCPACGMG